MRSNQVWVKGARPTRSIDAMSVTYDRRYCGKPSTHLYEDPYKESRIYIFVDDEKEKIGNVKNTTKR